MYLGLIIVLAIVVLWLTFSEHMDAGNAPPAVESIPAGPTPTVIIINQDERRHPYYQYDPFNILNTPYWYSRNYRPHRSFGHRRIW